jgi:hypothetical protein
VLAHLVNQQGRFICRQYVLLKAFTPHTITPDLNLSLPLSGKYRGPSRQNTDTKTAHPFKSDSDFIDPTGNMGSSTMDLDKWEATMKKYGIVFDADTNRHEWPAHLRKTFESIQKLGMKQWEQYSDDISATISWEPWREQRKQRAHSISMLAQACSKARANEQTWRSNIEHFIAGRFAIDVAWYVQKFKLKNSY